MPDDDTPWGATNASRAEYFLRQNSGPRGSAMFLQVAGLFAIAAAIEAATAGRQEVHQRISVPDVLTFYDDSGSPLASTPTAAAPRAFTSDGTRRCQKPLTNRGVPHQCCNKAVRGKRFCSRHKEWMA